MRDVIRSTISSGNHLRVFSVYIPFIISLVRPVHTFMEKKYIIENTSQTAANYLKKTCNKRDHPEKDGLFSFMRKNVLLAEFGSKEFSVQTGDMLH